MTSIKMNSTTPKEFPYFPKFPAELRKMVWDEALPTLDIQHFNAEITGHPDHPVARGSWDLVLCLTPNDDFVQLTKEYVGLLSACQESRAAAMDKIKGYLPIHYITQDQQDGSIMARSARVPYNPDGLVCISGLGPALHFAAEQGLGAQGTSIVLPRKNRAEFIASTITCVTLPEIKNLAIALDPPAEFMGEHCVAFGWDWHSFSNLVRRMGRHNKLETIELVDNGWLENRHDNNNHPISFEWLHKPTPITRTELITDNPGSGHWRPNVRTPWSRLLDDFRDNMDRLKAVRQLRRFAAAEARGEVMWRE